MSAPVTGIIVLIEEVEEKKILSKANANKYRFLCHPINVHVPAIPLQWTNSILTKFSLEEYLCLASPKASEENERTIL